MDDTAALLIPDQTRSSPAESPVFPSPSFAALLRPEPPPRVVALRPDADEQERLVGADRVLGILAELARHPDGISVDELATAMLSTKGTVHRALTSLRRAGFARQDGPGVYVLGEEFLRLAFTNHEARPGHERIRPVLEDLAGRYREAANYAVLDGDAIVYRAKVEAPRGGVRLTATVGERYPAHSTAAGKVLLAFTLPDDAAVRAWLGGRVLERRTEKTLVVENELVAALRWIRKAGFAVDDQENEDGINCVAVPVFLTSARVPSGAVSVSAPAYRTPVAALLSEVTAIRARVAGDTEEM